MIVTPQYNILLFPKCGTHFLASIFKEAAPDIDKWNAGLAPVTIEVNHLPSSMLPYGANTKPTAIVVRNVWDWYVSRYFYFENERYNGRGAFSRGYRVSKVHFVSGMWAAKCGYGRTITGFKKHLPYAIENFPLGEPFFEFISDAPQIYFIRHESIKEDLKKFVSAFGLSVNYPSILEKIEQAVPKNITPNRPPTHECYSLKEIELIYSAEQKYIHRFGQEFYFTKPIK